MAVIFNNTANRLLNGTNYADSIKNSAYDLSGNRYVTYPPNYVTIIGGAGDDTIENTFLCSGVIIDGGKDNDHIMNHGYNNSINGGNGNDTVYNDYYGTNTSISGGAGNDSINNWGSNVTIIGGTGNDTIYNNWNFDTNSIVDDSFNWGRNVLFKYNSGDGNDIIYGFKADSTLSIDGGSYSTTTSGSNIIVTVGKGKISLIGAASLSKVNIDGTEEKVEKDSWQLNGTTATYGTANKTLVTVKGVTSLNGLSVKKKVLTISKASLGTSKVKLSGDGYTLALADDVNSPTTSKKWVLDGTTADYNQTTSAGYTLASDSKSITYSKKTATTLATVKGVISLNGLSVKKKVITVSKASLGTSKVKLSGDGYTLALADGLAPTTKKATWTLKNSTATYNSSYKTAGYTLASNGKSISYTKATTPETLATVKGAKTADGLKVSGKVITLENSELKNKV
ncbi:MAG: hypothetical protein IJU91_09910, partial [Selenomonadaceae bacterium]|nr:hypothetical protein [Selenomonadaceae bacterium]